MRRRFRLGFAGDVEIEDGFLATRTPFGVTANRNWDFGMFARLSGGLLDWLGWAYASKVGLPRDSPV
jgi:hypothetical protein